jgi:predicted DNA-binding WGR domain protein
MRTFERRDGRGRRFWNIERWGGRLTVTYGQAGARGQTQVMDDLSDDDFE